MAERDILTRLQVQGGQFAEQINAMFGGISRSAAEAGEATTRSFAPASKTIEQVGRAGVEAAAGIDRLSGAILRADDAVEVYARAQAQAKTEVDALKVALKSGEIGLEQYNAEVLRSKQALGVARAEYRATSSDLERMAREAAGAGSKGLTPLNDNMEDATKRAGAMRFGMQNLGYQLGDVATMFALGARPMQIFASQSGQIIQSVQLMAGGTSRLATFLGGPWGIAMSTAAIALSPFIAKLFETEGQADATRDALEELIDAQRRQSEESARGANAEIQLIKDRTRAAELEAALDTPNRRGRAGLQQRAKDERELQDLRWKIAEGESTLRAREFAERERNKKADKPDTPSRRGKSAEERAAERAAKQFEREQEQAWQQEDRLRESIEKTIREQEDAIRVERVRVGLGERAAAEAEARLRFEREHPEALAETAAELAKMLGISGKLTKEQEKQLQADIERMNLARQGAVKEAGDKVDADAAEKQIRINEEIAKKWQREHEEAVRDVAALYEDLFTGGVDRVWKDFKSVGLRVVSEVAAEMTLALLSGQSINVGQTFQSRLFDSPLGSLLGGGRAANDNGLSPQFENAFKDMMAPGGTPGINPGSTGTSGGGNLFGSMSGALGPVGMYAAAVQVSDLVGKGISDLFGLKYDKTLGSIFGALGGIIGGLFKKTKKGVSTIGGSGDALSVLSTRGNSSKREEASAGLAGSVIDSVQRIADALGADVDASKGKVSIGIRKDDFRVDPTGAGNTKLKYGVKDFGSDQEGAIAYAIRDLIKDGVLTGISQASQNILKKGADLEKAIEKAVLIESVPKLLKQRLDPLGFALDEIDAKFRDLAAALKEGGASAEQIAQARRLWQLEREDTIQQIGAASSGLKDFLQTLAVGSNSPLSLRQQEAAAKEALQPFLTQIDSAQAARAEVDRLKASGASAERISQAEEAARIAAAKIDQGGFQDAAQTFLGLNRGINASSGNFFAEFDRIRQLTGNAISLVEAGATQPGAGKDPFSELIASNTGDTAKILSDQTDILKQVYQQLAAMNDNFVSAGAGWVLQQRNYV